MLSTAQKWFKDAGERVLWTAIEAAASAAIVYTSGLHWIYAPILTTILSMAKTVAAHYVGDGNTAAMNSGK